MAASADRAGPAAPTAAGGERKKTLAIGGVKQSDLTLFTRQFSTLLDAGLPIKKSLDILTDMLPPGILKNDVMDVADDVEGGTSLSEAMKKYPKSFDNLYVSMVQAGEAAGMLDTILTRLADFREKSAKLKKKIIGALIYPVAVLTIAGGILSLIIMYIVPKFKKMFEGMGMELPGLTQFLCGIADTMVNYWFLLPGIPIGFGVIFVGIKSTKPGSYAIDQISLYLPVFGTIIRKSSISRFCRTLGTLTASGVPILDALSIIKSAVGNKVIEGAVNDVHLAIREGESVSEPLRQHPALFDQLMVSMIEVGEETGELDKMLIKVADNYDSDVDTLVEGMMSLLEPFLIIGMGGAVAFIVIALFLPLVSIIENMGA